MSQNQPEFLLLGDSITAGFDTARLLPELAIRNEGVSGDSTVELLVRLRPEWLQAPGLQAVFVCIGTNDLARDRPDDYILGQIARLVAELRRVGGAFRVVLTSLFSTRDNEPRPNARILGFNAQLAVLAADLGVEFWALHPHFLDEDGQLRAEFTDDGLHLTAAAYAEWARQLRAFAKPIIAAPPPPIRPPHTSPHQ